MRHVAKAVAVCVVLLLSACSDEQRPPDKFSAYPEECFSRYENALSEVVGELYPQQEKSRDSRPKTGMEVFVTCSAYFRTDRTTSAGKPVDRSVYVTYMLFKSSDGPEDPIERSKKFFSRSILPKGERHPLNLGDEAGSWYETTPTIGGEAAFRDHNLIVSVKFDGHDQTAEGEEVPMPSDVAEAGAVKLAYAIAATL